MHAPRLPLWIIATLPLGALVSPTAGHAAEPSALTAKAGEPKQKQKPFLIRPFLALDQMSLELTRGSATVEYLPNTQLAVGLRAGYAGFTLSASIDVDASEDPALYGKSEYLALQAGRAFRVAERELFVSLFLQYHEGLYIEDSGALVDGSPPIVLPDMTVIGLGATATYYLNPELSYDDTFIEFLPRDDTVGSWTLRMSTGLMGFDNGGEPILPEAIRSRFGEVATLSGSGASYVGAMGGYTIDFRFWSRWLLASSLLVGATVAREGHDTDEGNSRSTTLAPAAMLALAFGYAGDTFHSGFLTTADLESSKAGPAEEAIIRTAFAMFVGVRF